MISVLLFLVAVAIILGIIANIRPPDDPPFDPH